MREPWLRGSHERKKQVKPIRRESGRDFVITTEADVGGIASDVKSAAHGVVFIRLQFTVEPTFGLYPSSFESTYSPDCDTHAFR